MLLILSYEDKRELVVIRNKNLGFELYMIFSS